MTVDLHYISKHGLNHHRLGDNMYESGEWIASDELASEAVGGRFYLHEKQKDRAWHGGTILGWRHAGKRKFFTYKIDGYFRFVCRGTWGQEKAVVRRT